MKKLLSAMLIALLLFPMFPPTETNATYDTSNAQMYLIAYSNNPWSTMALSALENPNIPTDHLISVNGTSAIDYAAPILAITALGQNPRTFASTDYVASLKNYYSENQIGDPTTLNDDFFGILALISAGEFSTDPIITNSKNFIFSHQNSDGGWGYTTASNSDTNMTAAAILALLASGTESSNSQIQSALSFLQTLQNDDGGFSYYSGASSDSSSTAWVVWALNALNINPDSLTKSGNTPILYLESNQDSQGFFKFQSDSSEDGFSAVTTAYAVLALQGKKLPLNIVTNNTSIQKTSFRIEGSNETVCTGEVAGITALDIIKNAKNICGFEYEIEELSWGPYLKRINNDQALGMTGWLYMVNGSSPPVGAADYELKVGDSVLWYYGEFGWQSTRLSLSSEQINTDQSVVVTAEFFDGDLWLPLSDAVVYFGAITTNTDSNGQAVVNLKDGFYKVYAQKQEYIRSNSILLKVGQPDTASVDMTVIIEQGDIKGDETEDTISFVVNPSDLNFGKLNPGSSATKNIVISNNGTVNMHMEALVSGDSLFIENIDLDNTYWKNFKADVDQDNSQNIDVKLSVPAGYSSEGNPKSAQLTFWAIAQ